jgi:hypothetical protein
MSYESIPNNYFSWIAIYVWITWITVFVSFSVQFFIAYREPHFYYQFTARYHAAPCNSIYNISFEKKLLQILSKLVLDLSCEISLLKSECHRIKMQRAGLQNELFFTFSGKYIKFFEQNNFKYTLWISSMLTI